MSNYMPRFDAWKWGLLDWNGRINPLATMIKCCHEFTSFLKVICMSCLKMRKVTRFNQTRTQKNTWNHQWNRYRSMESYDGYNA